MSLSKKDSYAITTVIGITDTSGPRQFGPGHFGTSLVGTNCPDRLALVPKFPKDSSELSSKLFPKVLMCLAPFLTTAVCSMIEKRHLYNHFAKS